MKSKVFPRFTYTLSSTTPRILLYTLYLLTLCKHQLILQQKSSRKITSGINKTEMISE